MLRRCCYGACVAGTWSTNHDMTRLVGLPACQAIEAFARGEYATVEALLRCLPPALPRATEYAGDPSEIF